MSKKQEGIKYLVGVRNALNNNGKSNVESPSEIYYDRDMVKQIINTVDAVLKLDNIVGIPSGGKV